MVMVGGTAVTVTAATAGDSGCESAIRLSTTRDEGGRELLFSLLERGWVGEDADAA